MTYGSLFSGVGGGDLGLDRAGWRPLWQVERDRQCNEVLASHWPDVRRYDNAMEVDVDAIERPDLIVAGDPCPCRSRARGIQGSKSPDLFPVVLRWVSALRPRWVLRENVVAPDVDACAEAIVRLGYAVVVAEVDSAQVTGQSRPRQYLLGMSRTSGICPIHALSVGEGMGGNPEASGETEATNPCLSTYPRRHDTRDGFVADTLCARAGKGIAAETFVDETGMGLRILSAEERERLQGFPVGWTVGHSFTARCRMLGNAMTVPVVEHFGRAVAAVEAREGEDAE